MSSNRQPIRPILLGVLIVLSMVGGWVSSQTNLTGWSPTGDVSVSTQTLREASIQKWLQLLAGDDLLGRRTLDAGLEIAAEHIGTAFAEAGLEPIGDTSFIQRFPVNVQHLDHGGAVLRINPHPTEGVSVHEYGRDYFVLPFPGREVSGVAVPVDSWESLEGPVEDCVVVLRLPGEAPGGEWSRSAVAGTNEAVKRGASGILFLLDPGFPPDAVSMLANGAGVGSEDRSPIGFAALRTGRGDSLTPSAFEGRLVTIRAPIKTAKGMAPNVLGSLTGRDRSLRDEYVVLVAHIDHLGIGPPDSTGDTIYNGADDNATGVALLVEVARALARTDERRRSFLFAAVSGEEQGLLGSRYLVDHLPVPARQLVATINVDMIGRNGPDTVIAIGQEYSTLGPTLTAVASEYPELSTTVIGDPNPGERLFFRSDHVIFASKGVPSLFLTSGLHDDYHRPSDEVELIDFEKVARVSELVYLLSLRIANEDRAPTWTPGGLEVLERLCGQNCEVNPSTRKP